MVDSAEHHGMKPNSQVKWWLEDAAARIVDKYQSRLQLPPNQVSGVKATYHLSKKADEILAEATSLKEKGDFHKVADELVQVRFEMPSAPVVGKDPLHRTPRRGSQVIDLHGRSKAGRVGACCRRPPNHSMSLRSAYHRHRPRGKRRRGSNSRGPRPTPWR